jgi:hypothetical protein
LDVVYKGVGSGEYEAPKSVWEMFGEGKWRLGRYDDD